MKKIETINRKNEKTSKKVSENMKKASLLMMLLFVSGTFAMPVYAGSGAVTSQFNILTDIVAAVVSSIGVIVTLWGLFEFGNAMQNQEGGAQSAAMKRIGGGLVMIIAPQLLVMFV